MHPRVSLIMIVKDEAANLAACVRSCEGLFDELVTVDTGSSDDTKVIAESLGARVFDFIWRDDFSVARNEAKDRAIGDYILWMDADDRLSETNRQRVRHLLKSLDGWSAYAFSSVSINEFGEQLPPVQQVRLFPNRKTLRWSGRIHEELIADEGARLIATDVEVDHLGYVDERLNGAKTDRNLRLLKTQLAESPDNPRTVFYFGAECAGAGQFREALPILVRAKELTAGDAPWRPALLYTLALCAAELKHSTLASASAAELASIQTDQAAQLFMRLPPRVCGPIIA